MPLTSVMFLPSTESDDTDSAPVNVAPLTGPNRSPDTEDGAPRVVEDTTPTLGSDHA